MCERDVGRVECKRSTCVFSLKYGFYTHLRVRPQGFVGLADGLGHTPLCSVQQGDGLFGGAETVMRCLLSLSFSVPLSSFHYRSIFHISRSEGRERARSPD